MTVHFIGAGPGAPDLITVRGLRLIRRCRVVLYAGSLVPEAVIAEAGKDLPAAPRVIDTAALDLDAIIGEMAVAARRGDDVARLHSGDPSFYGAIGEQMRRLRALGITYDVTPGVPAFAAAAAALEQELTLPGIAQSVVLTRTAVRASPMPEHETLAAFAATGATLAIHLSINNLARVVRELTPVCGRDCPVAVLYRVSWPDQRIIRGTLATIRSKMRGQEITRTALILIGRALAAADFADSRLYASDHHHVLRPATADGQAGRSSQARAASTVSTIGPGGGGGRRTITTGRPRRRAARSLA
jgi:precorrin-4/cobalt-precorrin-4 C11-methyltransferase